MTDLQIYFSITMGLVVVFIMWLESCTKDRDSNRKGKEK
jgi:hypothetical protein